MTYQFDTDLATEYGVDEAIMIANLAFWIKKNEANGKHFHDGRFWTYNSAEAFTKLFPFWSSGQIRRILTSLKNKGVLLTGNYNQSQYDRTMWYAFSNSICQKLQLHLSISTNGSMENQNCNNIGADNNTNSKPDDIPAEGGLFPISEDYPPVVVTRPRKTSEGLCLFENSRYADYAKFENEFKTVEFQGIDILYYFHAVADWSAQKGKKMRDWIATARNFIRRDMENGKVHHLPKAGGSISAEEIENLQILAEL